LDLRIDDLAHVRPPGIGEDAPVAEGPRPPLHPPLEPAHDLALAEALGGEAAERLVVAELGDVHTLPPQFRTPRIERPQQGRGTERRSPVSVVHDEAPGATGELAP